MFDSKHLKLSDMEQHPTRSVSLAEEVSELEKELQSKYYQAETIAIIGMLPADMDNALVPRNIYSFG